MFYNEMGYRTLRVLWGLRGPPTPSTDQGQNSYAPAPPCPSHPCQQLKQHKRSTSPADAAQV